MNYTIEKKLILDEFFKITDQEILKVDDRYIWLKNGFGKKIIDINGKYINTVLPEYELKHIKNGFFLESFSSSILLDNVYKENNTIDNIHGLIFDSNHIIGEDRLNKKVLLDDSGKIISKRYTNILNFSNNIAPVYNEDKKNLKYGFIDSKGKELIDLRYDYISRFHNHYAAFKKKNKYGIIDDNLDIVIPPKIKCSDMKVIGFDKLIIIKKHKIFITDFQNNILYKLKDNEDYIIDYNNESIYVYDKFSIFRLRDHKNYNDEHTFDNYLRICNSSIDNNIKIIDRNNNINILSDFGIKKAYENNIYVDIDNYYGLLYSNLKRKYNSIMYISNGLYIVNDGDKYGIINKYGSIIVPISYSKIDYSKLGDYYVLHNNNKILLDKFGNKIYKFEIDIDIIDYKNNFTVIKKLDNYILLDNNFNEIVRSKNQIFILNDKKVIVENHLIDLNSEYINFRYVYELHIMCNNKNLKFSFNNIRDLNECIEENSRKIDNLNSKLECYNNEIQNIGNEEVDHIKKYLKQ